MIAHEGFGVEACTGGAWRAAPRGGVRPRFFFVSWSLRRGARPLCGGRARARGEAAGAAGGCSLAEACDSSAWAQPPSRSAQGNASVLDMVFEELALAEVETSVVVRSFLNLKHDMMLQNEVRVRSTLQCEA